MMIFMLMIMVMGIFGSLSMVIMFAKIVVISIFQVLGLILINAEWVDQLHVFLCSEEVRAMVTVLFVMFFEG